MTPRQILTAKLTLLGGFGLLLGGCSMPQIHDSPLSRADYPHADAIVLLDEGRLTYVEDRATSGFVFERHVRLKVLTPRGRSRAEVAVPVDSFTTLDRLDGYSFGPGGSDLQSTSARALHDAPARPEAGVLFADGRVVGTTIPGVDVGDIVHYTYRVFSERAFAPPGWAFEWDIPVVRSRLMVDPGAGGALSWSYARRGRLASIEPTREEDDHGVWQVFERKDLSAFEPEPFGLPPAEQVERLRIRLGGLAISRSWESIAGWYRGLMAPRLTLPRAVQNRAKAATADMPPAERMAWVDRFVRDGVRYVAIHVGIGAFQPHAVEEVLEQGYGDCKDMAALYIALGRAVDLDVRPVLLGTRGHGVFDPDLPTVSAFDHVIVAIRSGDGWVYADPTDRDGRPGHLLPSVAGRSGLRVDTDGAALVELPASRPGDESVELSWRLDEGESVTLKARLTGLASYGASGAPPDPKGRAEWARAAFFGGDPAVVVNAVEIEHGPTVTVTVDARWPTLWIPLGDAQEGMTLHRFIGDSVEVRLSEKRTAAVDLGAPISRIVHLDLAGSPGDERLSPGVGSEETALGISRWTAEAADGRLRLTYALSIEEPRVEVDGLPALRALMEHSARVSRGMVIRKALPARSDGGES